MTNRILAVLLAAVLLLCAVFSCGCETNTEQKTDETKETDETGKTADPEPGESDEEPDEPTPDPVPVNYGEPLSLTGTLSATCTDWFLFNIEQSWTYNDETFIGTNDTFNKELALDALYLILAESNGIFTLDGQTVNLPETIGLSEVKRVDLSQMGYTIDANDVTKITLAQKTFTAADGTSYQLFTVVINPGYGTAGWRSNFDIGADTEDYIEVNGGESPDWIDKKEHKGFSVTAERVAQMVEKYIDTYSAASAQPIVFVTGQSRGGAIANLTAKHLIDRGQNTIAYCYNVPGTTTENDEKVLASYQTIYNVLNEDDIIPTVPPADWGFTRCGQCVTFSIAQDPTAWEALLGKTYICPDASLATAISSFLTGAADTREALYVFDESAEALAVQYLGTYDPATQAADIEKILNPTTLSADAKRYVKFITEDTETGTAIYYAIRPGFITLPLSGAVCGMFNGDSYTTLMMSVLPYLTYLSSYMSTLTGVITAAQGDSTMSTGVLYSHVVYTNFVGIEMISQ